MKGFHVTPARNLVSILRDGLVPQIGARSLECGEQEQSIYLFAAREDADDALMGWLGEQFDEDEALALIEVELGDVEVERQAFELVAKSAIPAGQLRVLERSL